MNALDISEKKWHVQGKGYGPKTDVWALGCILYELCKLRKAFDASNLGAITIRIMRCISFGSHSAVGQQGDLT